MLLGFILAASISLLADDQDSSGSSDIPPMSNLRTPGSNLNDTQQSYLSTDVGDIKEGDDLEYVPTQDGLSDTQKSKIDGNDNSRTLGSNLSDTQKTNLFTDVGDIKEGDDLQYKPTGDNVSGDNVTGDNVTGDNLSDTQKDKIEEGVVAIEKAKSPEME